MYKITNIETLGTDYSVANQHGKILQNIKIIPHTEILEAALGEYDEEHGTMSEYIEKSLALLEGNENMNFYNIYWYSTEDSEVVLSEVIEYAIKYGYDTVIVEHLEPVEN